MNKKNIYTFGLKEESNQKLDFSMKTCCTVLLMSTNNSFSCRNKTKYTLYRAMQSAIHICIHDYIITVSLISSLVNVSRAKTCLRVYADSKGPDQTAHLIRAFAICE